MTIINEHLQFYREIFQFPEFWNEPFLMIGVPYIIGPYMPKDFTHNNLKQLLIAKGLSKVTSLDLYDPRADLSIDLNNPVSQKFHNKYRVLADFGTIEHIFDTRQCLENYC